MTSAARAAPGPDRDQAVRPASATAAARVGRVRAAARRHRTDLLVGLLFVAFAGGLTHGLWPTPGARMLALNPADQTLYEWFLALDARALRGDFSLVTDRLNAPDGVNLMANTSVVALGVLLAPVTWAFGAPVTFALLVAGNLAGTAVAWYLLFTRTLRAHRLAAGLGAALCGFGPGMVSQSNGHLHMTAQWLVPVLVWLVVRLLRAADPAGRPDGPDRRRMISSAVGLAGTAVVQVFVGEEVLFLTVLTLAVLAVAYGLADRELPRRALPGFAGGLLGAAGLALVVLAYPLRLQFAGPQGVADGMFPPDYFSADLTGWARLSALTVLGSPEAVRLTTGPAEFTTFLGWPLLVVATGCAVWLGRRALVRALVAAALVLAAFSLGPEVVAGGERTGVPGPYALLAGLPVVDGALPTRFALAVLPLVGTVLTLAVHRALHEPGPARRLVPLAVGAALLSVFPTPLPTIDRPPLPTFVTGGHWRQCVRPGGVLVPVPTATPQHPGPMRWATATGVGFGMPEGFFIGPYGPGGSATMGTWQRPTSALLADVARRGVAPAVGDRQRRQAARDVDAWGASCVALTDDAPHAELLRRTLEALFGPGTRVADAWTWRF
ncbi:hypothetical protein [Micromonospora sp. AKA38]|uniref:hypothetical protein n=1 Tax=Micromonospora sp. AKA38 TaxID=2733861 RepID=UPI0022BEDE5D|nr:hypothetical protein [Micromonospora sp. AKA38]GHJ18357.1 glycosyl transferase [Micromonospora sp. AKA38]GHJ18383.1 glycosyl transferase [Micromonospora sp. AKA38]